jgi:glycosyltransferase involved in cell wall biosynthesis
MSIQHQYHSASEQHSVANQSIREKKLPEILVITSYPPRECGIATYSNDLITALNKKFNESFNITICALESDSEKHVYPDEVKYTLDTDRPDEFDALANVINKNSSIQLVLVQHEFGFFRNSENEIRDFLQSLKMPVILAFHTVLPYPDEHLQKNVQQLTAIAKKVIVMTNSSVKILTRDYAIAEELISVIPHGTHLVPYADVLALKEKYNLNGKQVLTTFGLLSSGKSIETTLNALPAIVAINPDVLFLIIGKTHPSVIKHEGEKYRHMLEEKVVELNLQAHVRFINAFLKLPDLLEYLQLTDIYLFTSKNPNQAVSGTFAYAISCGCPVISTPIPHAREVLRDDGGIIVEFESHEQVANAVNSLLSDESRRKRISLNGLHRMASTAWENSAIAHALLFADFCQTVSLQYTLPPVNLNHVKKLTTDFGLIQFSKVSQPDLDTGYTLDDNARALIAMCQHYELTSDEADLKLITIYLNFIKYCLRPEGTFLNYVDEFKSFTEQNNTANLADANGRAIWALGYLVSMSDLLPKRFEFLSTHAELIMDDVLLNLSTIHSTRAMAFAIKGLYYYNKQIPSVQNTFLIKSLASRLVQMYRHEAVGEWKWFESYLTYANSLLPEALLCAWLATGDQLYKEIAKTSFDFLLSKTFLENQIKVISNKSWLQSKKQSKQSMSGEQPIDVAYTILALHKFYDVFQDKAYAHKMKISFEWFLGNNHLNQIIYNPCTGGCYDGLEDNYVNLNQGAESTISYLMARLTVIPKPDEHGLEHAQEQFMELIE